MYSLRWFTAQLQLTARLYSLRVTGLQQVQSARSVTAQSDSSRYGSARHGPVTGQQIRLRVSTPPPPRFGRALRLRSALRLQFSYGSAFGQHGYSYGYSFGYGSVLVRLRYGQLYGFQLSSVKYDISYIRFYGIRLRSARLQQLVSFQLSDQQISTVGYSMTALRSSYSLRRYGYGLQLVQLGYSFGSVSRRLRYGSVRLRSVHGGGYGSVSTYSTNFATSGQLKYAYGQTANTAASGCTAYVTATVQFTVTVQSVTVAIRFTVTVTVGYSFTVGTVRSVGLAPRFTVSSSGTVRLRAAAQLYGYGHVSRRQLYGRSARVGRVRQLSFTVGYGFTALHGQLYSSPPPPPASALRLRYGGHGQLTVQHGQQLYSSPSARVTAARLRSATASARRRVTVWLGGSARSGQSLSVGVRLRFGSVTVTVCLRLRRLRSVLVYKYGYSSFTVTAQLTPYSFTVQHGKYGYGFTGTRAIRLSSVGSVYGRSVGQLYSSYSCQSVTAFKLTVHGSVTVYGYGYGYSFTVIHVTSGYGYAIYGSVHLRFYGRLRSGSQLTVITGSVGSNQLYKLGHTVQYGYGQLVSQISYVQFAVSLRLRYGTVTVGSTVQALRFGRFTARATVTDGTVRLRYSYQFGSVQRQLYSLRSVQLTVTVTVTVSQSAQRLPPQMSPPPPPAALRLQLASLRRLQLATATSFTVTACTACSAYGSAIQLYGLRLSYATHIRQLQLGLTVCQIYSLRFGYSSVRLRLRSSVTPRSGHGTGYGTVRWLR